MSSQPISNAAPGVGTSPGSWTERLKLLYKGDASSAVGRWLPFAPYAALMVVAAVMRLWDLDLRAMHHDESLHAYFAFQLSSGAGYQHDPMMHGPLQMEATAGLFRLLGDSDFTARLLYAIAGVVLVGMPYFFRQRLGNLGALLVAVMFLFSPTLLYFSRFARNDILMAVFTFGLVITMWRYLDEGKNKYLYLFAGLLALAFATKETAYVVTVALGLYLFGVIVIRNWSRIARGVMEGEVSPPVALARLVRGAWSSTMVGLRLDDPSRRGHLVPASGHPDAAFLVGVGGHTPGYASAQLDWPGAFEPGGRAAADRLSGAWRAGYRLSYRHLLDWSVVLLRSQMELAGLVEGRRHLLRYHHRALLYLLHQLCRLRLGLLAVPWLLGCPAGGGPRRPAVLLLPRNRSGVRVPADGLRHRGRSLLHDSA